MTQTVNIHYAKTHLSRLLMAVNEGGEIVVAKNGKPVAKLTSVEDKKPRKPGRFLGQIPQASVVLEQIDGPELDLWGVGYVSDPVRTIHAPKLPKKAATKKP